MTATIICGDKRCPICKPHMRLIDMLRSRDKYLSDPRTAIRRRPNGEKAE